MSQEFVFLNEGGEDTVVVCDRCDYAANTEKAEFVRPPAEPEEPLALEEVETPDATTIEALTELLGVDPARTAKAVFFTARLLGAEGPGEPVFVVVRGDLEVNEVKLSNALGGRELEPMSEAELQRAGIVAGYASPIGAAAGVRVVADLSIPDSPNLVAGANREGFHLRNANYGRDWEAEVVADIATAQPGHRCVRCDGGTLRAERAIEMGHVFRLGLAYTEPLDVGVLDDQGQRRMPVMGCYGIGIDRIRRGRGGGEQRRAWHPLAGLHRPLRRAPRRTRPGARRGRRRRGGGAVRGARPWPASRRCSTTATNPPA